MFSPWVFHGAHASQNFMSETNPRKKQSQLGTARNKGYGEDGLDVLEMGHETQMLWGQRLGEGKVLWLL